MINNEGKRGLSPIWSHERSPYALNDPQLIADVQTGERLMTSYFLGNGGFVDQVALKNFLVIDQKQAEIVKTMPVVQAQQSYADTLARLKAGTYEGQQAQNLSEALPLASTWGLSSIGLSALKVGTGAKILIGASTGGAFDATGQLIDSKNGPYRIGQTLTSAILGGIAFPLSGRTWYWDAALGSR